MFRSTKSWRVIAAGAASVLVLSACGSTDDGGDDDGGGGDAGGGAACDQTLAFFGPETGPAAGLGAPIIQGMQLAVDEYNADADCAVEMIKYDSQGSPDQAPSLATEAAGNEAVVGVVGPA